MADRFFCPEPPIDGRLALGPEESHHLARVRRLGIGEVVEVFDGRGMAYRAEVQRVGKDRVELGILAAHALPGPTLDLTLATAVPKGERFDWLVEKATELGVSRLVPLVVQRSTVEPRPAKLDRLRRLIIEASKQCGRARLMLLDEPMAWGGFLERQGGAGGVATRVLAHPGGVSLAGVPVRRGVPVVAAIGPEGGFTDAEVEAARDRGWAWADLGPTILRVETAGLAACAILASRLREG